MFKKLLAWMSRQSGSILVWIFQKSGNILTWMFQKTLDSKKQIYLFDLSSELAKTLIVVLLKAFKSRIRRLIEPTIKELYRKIAWEDLRLKTDIIKVKKGTRRYDLLVFETKEGVVKFNLGRRWEENIPLEEPLKTNK